MTQNNQIYCLPNFKIHELRGTIKAISLSMTDCDQLSTALASYARDDSILCKLINYYLLTIYHVLLTIYHFLLHDYHILLHIYHILLNFIISVTDLVYDKYLVYLQTGRLQRGVKKNMGNYVKDLLKCSIEKNSIIQQARDAGENEEDIVMDIHILQNTNAVIVLNIYYNALIFSQVFQVKLKKGSHLLLCLAGLAKL